MSSQPGEVNAEVRADGVLLQSPAHLMDPLHHRVWRRAWRAKQDTALYRTNYNNFWSSVCPFPWMTIKHLKQLFKIPTSVCDVELDPEVSAGTPGVVTGCEDDPADGLDLPDDAGDGGGGQEAVVADYKTTDLQSVEPSQHPVDVHHVHVKETQRKKHWLLL